MENKISECASAIIDGLGYEIISDNGIIIGFKDKESQKVFGRSGDDKYFDFYELKDGLKVKLYYRGTVEIVFPNNKSIRITKNVMEPYVYISIGYNITPEKKTHVSIDFSPSSNSKEGDVIGGSDFKGIKHLIRIYANDDEFKWHCFDGSIYEKKSHEARDLTPEKIMELLEDCFKNYNDGDDWNDDLKHGLEVINPAINIITAYFKKSWATRLNHRIRANTEQYNKNKSDISTAESKIEDIKKKNREIYGFNLDTSRQIDDLLRRPDIIDNDDAISRSKDVIRRTRKYFSNLGKIEKLDADIANIRSGNNDIIDFNLGASFVIGDLLSDPETAKLYGKKPESQWKKTGEN